MQYEELSARIASWPLDKKFKLAELMFNATPFEDTAGTQFIEFVNFREMFTWAELCKIPAPHIHIQCSAYDSYDYEHGGRSLDGRVLVRVS